MKGVIAIISCWVSFCAFVHSTAAAPTAIDGHPARKTNGLLVNLTILQSAVSKGAVCLDGSPPAYNFAPGFGSGVNNWLVHFEGGGWCHNATNCLYRSRRGRLGTSKAMKTTSFNGILNDRVDLNPDFYNWNKIKIRYCDGSSYTGDVESVDSRSNLHYRGARIFVAMMEEFLGKGMKNAQNALLSGCSAGGLASMLHCDRFRQLLPATARVKCLSDAGFFVNAKDITGGEFMRTFFKEIVTTHNSAKNLPSACTSRLRPDLCFFPQYMVKHIETPFFILNSAYDSWQIRNVLVPPGSDPQGTWDDCRSDISLCNTQQIQAMQGFRQEFLRALGRFGQRPSVGMFINSCFAHCQTELTRMWHSPNSPVLGNLTVAEAVGRWFFDRGEFKEIDCPYPCDNSCQTMKYPNPKSRNPPGQDREHPEDHHQNDVEPAEEHKEPAATAAAVKPKPEGTEDPNTKAHDAALAAPPVGAGVPAADQEHSQAPAHVPAADQDHHSQAPARVPAEDQDHHTQAPAHAPAARQDNSTAPAHAPAAHQDNSTAPAHAPGAHHDNSTAPAQVPAGGGTDDHHPQAPAGAPVEADAPGPSQDAHDMAPAPGGADASPGRGLQPQLAGDHAPAGAQEEGGQDAGRLAPDAGDVADPPEEDVDHQSKVDQSEEKVQHLSDESESAAPKSSQEWRVTLKRHLFLLPALSSLFYLYSM